ncbi:uncharacterized protein UV8b_06878 [Ustilaginoidea virens]|uniref:Uncharacterized protein n=1 Tax=Ustilaginoidea virens TaxID=1159556 RepID=A0A8E5MK07_USTVR|nr:uncharacterized protein UV8b_06878 [Ustilaginoidea virens]QUC22637.1 hypothetical protein UV8b_06878 [Ustilaginoidea virens]
MLSGVFSDQYEVGGHGTWGQTTGVTREQQREQQQARAATGTGKASTGPSASGRRCLVLATLDLIQLKHHAPHSTEP